MNPTLKATRLFIAAMLGCALRAQPETTATAGENGSTELYLSTKALLEKYAYSDAPDERASEAVRTMRAKGPEVIPALVRLFHENENDSQIRSVAFGALFLIREGGAAAIQLLETELKKDPQEWHGGGWMMGLFEKVAEIDPARARWAALRALELDDDISMRPFALTALRKIGQSADILALESFIEKHKREKPAETFEGIRAYARATIDAIRARVEKEKSSVKLQPVTAPLVGAGPAVAPQSGVSPAKP